MVQIVLAYSVVRFHGTKIVLGYSVVRCAVQECILRSIKKERKCVRWVESRSIRELPTTFYERETRQRANFGAPFASDIFPCATTILKTFSSFSRQILTEQAQGMRRKSKDVRGCWYNLVRLWTFGRIACVLVQGFPFWVWFLVLRVFLVLVWGMALRACSGAGSGGCRGFYAEYRQNLYEFSP